MTVLTVSDTHAPFHHPDVIDFLADLKREYKPTEVVHLGDEADLHRFSRHDHEADAPGPSDELLGVRRFVEELSKLFPKLRLCNSNHIARLHKRAATAGLPPEVLREWSSIIHAPKAWQWADEWRLGEVVYFHGDGYSGAQARKNAVLDFRSSVCFGHLHATAGVEYVSRPGWTAWAMNAGCLVDVNSPAMRYGKACRAKPVLGTAVIVDGVPIFRELRV